VNTPQTEAEVEALRECVRRRRPYGDEAWADRAAIHLGLEPSLRPRGRPRKKPDDAAPLFSHTKGRD
jgi:putative transposase